MSAYGLPGKSAPTPSWPVLIGGESHGQRFPVPSDVRGVLRVAKLHPTVGYGPTYPAEAVVYPEAIERFEQYRERTFCSCWAAQPVRFWVAEGILDDEAAALIRWSIEGSGA